LYARRKKHTNEVFCAAQIFETGVCNIQKDNLMDKLIQSFACENRAEIVVALKELVISSPYDLCVFAYGYDDIDFGEYEVRCISQLLEPYKSAACDDTRSLAQTMCEAMSGIPLGVAVEQFAIVAQQCRDILERPNVICTVVEILPMPIWEEIIDQL